jgi:transposase
VPMLAELIDAVVGVDTHRDTHELEIAAPSGATLAVCSISNDSHGYAQATCWIAEHAPGPRVVAAVEGTRSYGVGLTRALTEAGLTVIECEQPARTTRRGRGKSDAIDAHLAVAYALRLDADRLLTPRADGDRDALRILLVAREELTSTSTAQNNRLKALLRDGDDTRMRDCPSTRDYVARRTQQGKNKPEIRRCLKRYIARQLHRTLTRTMTQPA